MARLADFHSGVEDSREDRVRYGLLENWWKLAVEYH